MRRLVRLFAAVLVCVSGLTIAAGTSGARTAILGGGSGFAALEIDQWRASTARSPYNLNINYVAQGSTFGRNQFSGGQFDYGASDIQYMQLEIPDLQSRRCAGKSLAQCFVYVPVSAGGLAFMYNLNDGSGRRVNDLRLTRDAACKIFTGAITKWNDPEIVKTNHRLAAINRDIHPIIRSDGAGESYVFSEFCKAVRPKIWDAFVKQQKAGGGSANLTPEFAAGEPTSVWPQEAWGANPVGVATADGTAGYVADPVSGPNAITYVAAGYAKVRNFPTASIQNAVGVFTQPDENNVTIALGYASERGNGTFQLRFDGPDRAAYFPSTYSYVLAQTAGFTPSKGATLGQFLCYAVSQGQVVAPQLRYARLSTKLVDIAINAIVRIPGAPAKSNCFVAGAPPPPPPPQCAGCAGGGAGPAAAGGGGAAASNRSSDATKKSASAAAKAAAAKAAAARAAASDANDAAAADAAGDAQADLAKALESEAAGHTEPASGSSTPTLWLLVAGVLAAWALSALVARKRASP